MRARHLGKAVAGFLTIGALIGLLGLPAASTSVTGGVIDLYDMWNDPLGAITLSTACDPSLTSAISKTGTTASGTWMVTTNADMAVSVAGVSYRAVVSGSFSGTYSGANLTGVGGFTATFRRSTGACTVSTGAGPCTVTAKDIYVFGTHTATSVTISGDNAFGGEFGFEVEVVGSATDCGLYIPMLDDGYVELVNVVVQ